MSRTYRKPTSICWDGRIPTREEYAEKTHMHRYYGEYEEFVAKLTSDNYRWGQVPAWFKNMLNRKVRRGQKRAVRRFDPDSTVVPRGKRNARSYWL